VGTSSVISMIGEAQDKESAMGSRKLKYEIN
jgi:hypothetical protein